MESLQCIVDSTDISVYFFLKRVVSILAHFNASLWENLDIYYYLITDVLKTLYTIFFLTRGEIA